MPPPRVKQCPVPAQPHQTPAPATPLQNVWRTKIAKTLTTRRSLLTNTPGPLGPSQAVTSRHRAGGSVPPRRAPSLPWCCASPPKDTRVSRRSTTKKTPNSEAKNAGFYPCSSTVFASPEPRQSAARAGGSGRAQHGGQRLCRPAKRAVTLQRGFFKFYFRGQWLKGRAQRAGISGAESGWRPGTSGVPRGQYWAQSCSTSSLVTWMKS